MTRQGSESPMIAFRGGGAHDRSGTARRRLLRNALVAAVGDMQVRALALDRSAAFPVEDIALLRRLGALAAPVPVALGGLGLGTEPDAALDTEDVLRLLGNGNVSVGRLYEAHVNALRLIMRDGTPAQRRRSAAAALDGALFGLWVTDAPDAPVVLSGDFVLRGAKSPCSGAAHIRHALVTTRLTSGAVHMLVIDIPEGRPADDSAWPMQGMRAAGNGRVSVDGIAPGRDAIIGDAGAYLRQPEFSAGAWRGMAVALGGMEALVGVMRGSLLARGHAADPHQRVRIGEALIALETARMWVRRVALLAEAGTGDPGDVANGVNLARIAVEAAGLDIIRLAQRGLGLAAFRRGALAELLMRDLATYLRQPAPDATLTEAAAHFTARGLPPLPC